MIRSVEIEDATQIARIYNHYVSNTVITFEECEVTDSELASRISACNDSDLPWLVSESNGCIVGYSNSSKWKGRSAYRHTAEVSVYLDRTGLRRGIGTELYLRLFDELRSRSYHSVIGGIALPNPASIALHEKLGMEKVAHFREVGYKHKQWVDVGYWQMTLDE